MTRRTRATTSLCSSQISLCLPFIDATLQIWCGKRKIFPTPQWLSCNPFCNFAKIFTIAKNSRYQESVTGESSKIRSTQPIRRTCKQKYQIRLANHEHHAIHHARRQRQAQANPLDVSSQTPVRHQSDSPRFAVACKRSHDAHSIST